MKLFKCHCTYGEYIINLKSVNEKYFTLVSLGEVDFYLTDYAYYLNTVTKKAVRSKHLDGYRSVYVTLKGSSFLIDSFKTLQQKKDEATDIKTLLSWCDFLKMDLLKNTVNEEHTVDIYER